MDVYPNWLCCISVKFHILNGDYLTVQGIKTSSFNVQIVIHSANLIFSNHLRIVYFRNSATHVKSALICIIPKKSWFCNTSTNSGKIKKLMGRYIRYPVPISKADSIRDLLLVSCLRLYIFFTPLA